MHRRFHLGLLLHLEDVPHCAVQEGSHRSRRQENGPSLEAGLWIVAAESTVWPGHEDD